MEKVRKREDNFSKDKEIHGEDNVWSTAKRLASS